MTTGHAQRVRCAIYTRKSSEEGLEQAFNSLDAPREACAAYVLSQASEGWVASPTIYDDGGLSGGTLELPALKRLLADVAAGEVDIIVVYKVDRLTRSLFDFAKLVETLDKAGTSFVSVTQSFNTTTSMGRLTLNMLLSFAQFEREVTAERIRDKIAASKAKGMWMGGTPPLGYAPDGRTLKMVEPEAALIRRLFERYLALGNVRLLEAELRAGGVTLPVRVRLKTRQTFGGGWFSRGQLHAILRNQIYIGRIPHGDTSYVGLHSAIVDADLWGQTQAKLTEQRQGERQRVRAASPSLLAGKVVDAHGQPLIASHANKAGRRYRYYISQSPEDGTSGQGSRSPALELEAAVTERIAQAFDDAFALAGSASLEITPAVIASLPQCGAAAAGQLRSRHRDTVRGLVEQVRVHADSIVIDCTTVGIAHALQLDLPKDPLATTTFTAMATLTRSGRAMRLVQDNGMVSNRNANGSLIRLLIRARRWWAILRKGEQGIKQLAATEGVQASYITRAVRLVFLSPAVVEGMLKGSLHASVDVAALTATEAVEACWRQQAKAFLPVRDAI